MGETDELNALKGAISAGAAALLDALNAKVPQGPDRDANSGVASVIWVSCKGVGIAGLSSNGSVTFKPVPGTPFARIDVGGVTYLSSLDNAGGDFRILRGLTDSPYGRVDLTLALDDVGTHWSLGPFVGGTMIAVVDAPGPKIYLSNEGLAESISSLHGYQEPDLFSWTVSTTPPDPLPPPPPSPAPKPILPEVFWWGLHFVIPEELMSTVTSAGLTAAEILDDIADFTGPAAPFIEAFAEYLEAEFDLAKDVDKGNGVLISMSWFAPLIFVPTPI